MEAAPHIAIQLLPFQYGSARRLFDRGADVAIVPNAMLDPAFGTRPLFDHELTGLVWDGFPLHGDEMSRDVYFGGRHAALFEEIEAALFDDRVAEPIVEQRRIVVRTAHYAMLPHLVIGTDLIVTTSNWLAQYYASVLPVRVVSLPIPRRPSILSAQWESHREREPIIRWITDLLAGSVDWAGHHQRR